MLVDGNYDLTHLYLKKRPIPVEDNPHKRIVYIEHCSIGHVKKRGWQFPLNREQPSFLRNIAELPGRFSSLLWIVLQF